MGGRRSKGDRHTFTVRLPMQDALKLAELSEQSGVTLNDLITAAVSHSLEHLQTLAPHDDKQLPLTG